VLLPHVSPQFLQRVHGLFAVSRFSHGPQSPADQPPHELHAYAAIGNDTAAPKAAILTKIERNDLRVSVWRPTAVLSNASRPAYIAICTAHNTVNVIAKAIATVTRSDLLTNSRRPTEIQQISANKNAFFKHFEQRPNFYKNAKYGIICIS
jgi:poly(A) polymerase Pap1